MSEQLQSDGKRIADALWGLVAAAAYHRSSENIDIDSERKALADAIDDAITKIVRGARI